MYYQSELLGGYSQRGKKKWMFLLDMKNLNIFSILDIRNLGVIWDLAQLSGRWGDLDSNTLLEFLGHFYVVWDQRDRIFELRAVLEILEVQ